jgi:hypothetical protein
MEFPEPIKLEAKRRANFCCVCCQQVVFVEVHHIIPPGEGGSCELENAAPLCPSHHTLYGDNPRMRKFIREARDFWWDYCAKQAASPATIALREGFDRIQTQVSEGHREMLAEVKAVIAEQLRGVADAVSSARSVQEVVEATSSGVTIYGSGSIIVPSPVIRGTGWVGPPPSSPDTTKQ